MSLVSAAQLRTHVPQLSGTGEDTALETLADRADSLIAHWCGWPETVEGSALYTMSSATYTSYPKPWWKDSRALDVGLYWMTSVSQIRIDPDWGYGASFDVSTSSTRIDNARGLLWLLPTATDAWSTAELANRVQIVNGFTDGAAPEFLQYATALVVRHIISKGRKGEVETKSEGGRSVTPINQGDALPEAARNMLAPLVIWGGSRVG